MLVDALTGELIGLMFNGGICSQFSPPGGQNPPHN
jgi:hypothetical protein